MYVNQIIQSEQKIQRYVKYIFCRNAGNIRSRAAPKGHKEKTDKK